MIFIVFWLARHDEVPFNIFLTENHTYYYGADGKSERSCSSIKMFKILKKQLGI